MYVYILYTYFLLEYKYLSDYTWGLFYFCSYLLLWRWLQSYRNKNNNKYLSHLSLVNLITNNYKKKSKV